MFSEISKTPVFKGFKTSEIIQLLNTTHYQIRSYEAENIIAYSGDKCENLYILLKGSVRGEIINYSEKTVIVSDIHAPDTFSEAFLFADNNNLIINIIASTKVKIMIIYKNDFLNLLNNNKKILINYLNITSNRFVIVTQKVRFLMIKTIKGKLANYILDLEKDNSDKSGFKLKKTHEQLANLFGVTRPAITRNIKKLQDEGFINIENKMVKILDRKRLIQLLEY